MASSLAAFNCCPRIAPPRVQKTWSRCRVPPSVSLCASLNSATNGRRAALKRGAVREVDTQGVTSRQGVRATPRRRKFVRHSGISVRAKADSTQKLVGDAVKVGNQALDAAVQLLPPTIPKPVGKVGVGLVGLAISLSIVQAVFNSFITLLILGGLGYAGFTYLSKGESTSTSKGEDPLEEARRIMDKYK